MEIKLGVYKRDYSLLKTDFVAYKQNKEIDAFGLKFHTSAKQRSHEIPSGIFSTNPWNRNGNKFSNYISQHIHGFARRFIYIICKNKNIIWPELYKSFIDDGFGVIKSNKKEFSKWVFEFNCLRENIFIDK